MNPYSLNQILNIKVHYRNKCKIEIMKIYSIQGAEAETKNDFHSIVFL